MLKGRTPQNETVDESADDAQIIKKYITTPSQKQQWQQMDPETKANNMQKLRKSWQKRQIMLKGRTPQNETVDEEYANEPDELIASSDTQLNAMSGGLNKQKRQFNKGYPGDNSMQVDETKESGNPAVLKKAGELAKADDKVYSKLTFSQQKSYLLKAKKTVNEEVDSFLNFYKKFNQQ